MKSRTCLWLAAAALTLAGCSTYPISKPLRQAARKDVTFEVAVKEPPPYKGVPVIWGGYIVETVNYPTYTEITVLAAQMDSSGDPGRVEDSPGRFIARISKFLDPAVYRKGRRVTIAARIVGQETRAIGKVDYVYPVTDIEEMYMWPRERPYPYDPAFEFGFWYGPGFFEEDFRHEGHRH